MANTIIISCTHCDGLLLAVKGQKTRTCPYCGKQIDIHRANKVASTENAFEASQILRDLKNKRQKNAHSNKKEID